MHEHLISPRPVRIVSNPIAVYGAMRRPTPVAPIRLGTPPIEQFSLLRLDPDADMDPDSQRPISTLPQETLEEFLSILRPSMLPISTFHRYPTSPVRRTHKSRPSFSSGMPAFAQQHFGSRPNSPFASQDLFKPDSAIVDETQRDNPTELEYIPSFWQRNGLLHSPVSRNHTMNPFARRPSHENLALAFTQYAYPPQSPVASIVWQQVEPPPPTSPALIPLPRSVSPTSPNGSSKSSSDPIDN